MKKKKAGKSCVKSLAVSEEIRNFAYTLSQGCDTQGCDKSLTL